MSRELCLAVAENRIRHYANEAGHSTNGQQDALDCEQFLKCGIEAYKWLKYAEELLREADYSGIEPFTPELQSVVNGLYAAWLEPCSHAEAWIIRNVARGLTPENLTEFRAICEDVEEAVQNREWRQIAKSARTASAHEE